jgi:tripartite-type tricarboxylate transporter receptor subunit TctC
MGATLGLWTAFAFAADYPDRPIRLVVAFASGSNLDLTARQIAGKFSEHLAQPVIVDNRGGAGGTIGTSVAARARPDGYTILMGNAPTIAVAPHLYRNLPYDPIKDFSAIGRTSSATFVLAISSTLPVTSVADLVAYAKSHPGRLNYASVGNGTTAHMSGALFNNKAGTDIRHVPYNDVSRAFIDIANGTVALIFYPYQPLMPMMQAGKIRPLATTGLKREPYLPEVPTVIEGGIPDFVAINWHGFYAPAGTSKPVIDVLYGALAKSVRDPKVVSNLAAAGINVDLAPPGEFASFTKAEVERYRYIVSIAGIKME